MDGAGKPLEEFLEEIGAEEETIRELKNLLADRKRVDVVVEDDPSVSAYVVLDENLRETARIHVGRKWIEKMGKDTPGTIAHEMAHIMYQFSTVDQIAASAVLAELLGNYYGLFADLFVDNKIGKNFDERLKEHRKNVLLKKIKDSDSQLQALFYSTLETGEYGSYLDGIEDETLKRVVRELTDNIQSRNIDAPIWDPEMIEIASAFKNIIKELGEPSGYSDVRIDLKNLDPKTRKRVMQKLGKMLKKSKSSATYRAIIEAAAEMSEDLLELYMSLAEGLSIYIPNEQGTDHYSMLVGKRETTVDKLTTADIERISENPEEFYQGGHIYHVPSEKISVPFTIPEGEKKNNPIVIIIDSSGSMQNPEGVKYGSEPSYAVLSAFTLLKSFEDNPAMIVNFSSETLFYEFDHVNKDTYRAVLEYQCGETDLETKSLSEYLEKFKKKYGSPLIFLITDLAINNDDEVRELFGEVGKYARGGAVFHITSGESEGSYGSLDVYRISNERDLLNLTLQQIGKNVKVESSVYL